MTTKATAGTVLDTLSNVGGYVGVAIQLGEVLVPLGKALIQKIENIGQGNPTITYQLLVQGDQAELSAVDKLSADDLTAINAELARLGAAPVPVPPAE